MVVDEAWGMMQHEDAASFLFASSKKCRKYYLGLTTITQDISDFMRSKYGKPIVTNSSLILQAVTGFQYDVVRNRLT